MFFYSYFSILGLKPEYSYLHSGSIPGLSMSADVWPGAATVHVQQHVLISRHHTGITSQKG